MTTPKTVGLSPELHAYLVEHGSPPDATQRSLIEETAALGGVSIMQVAPEQGAFLEMLVRVTGAKRLVEVGTFTGYSALACALAMPEDGHIYALDISAEWTAIARRYWASAGVNDRIDLLLDDAQVSLRKLLTTEAGCMDFIFIDADKTGYPAYINAAHELLRPGGLLALDNTLWDGAVADPDIQDADTVAIRAVNAAMLKDERFDISLVPIGDGLTLARKR